MQTCISQLPLYLPPAVP